MEQRMITKAHKTYFILLSLTCCSGLVNAIELPKVDSLDMTKQLDDLSEVAHGDTSVDGVVSPKAERYEVPKDLAMGIKHQSYDFSSIEESDAELAMDYTQVKIPLGKYDIGNSFVVPTIALGKTAFRFDNADVDNQEVYTLKTQLMVVTPGEEWTRIIQVTPSLHSDLDALDEDAFSLMGLAVWRYQSTDVSAWTMGIGFNRLFGEYKPIPLVSYQYKVANNIQLDLGFPITKAEYRWQSDWSTYASIAPVGGNWRYETEDHKKLNISYTTWIAATGIRYQFKPKMWGTFEIGRSLSGQLNLDTDSNINEDLSVADAPVVMLSFGFHP